MFVVVQWCPLCNCHSLYARGGRRTIPRHFPSSSSPIKVASVSRCVCVYWMVLWKIICIDEYQWEIVITTPNDGSIVVSVAIVHRLKSDNGRVKRQSAVCCVVCGAVTIVRPFLWISGVQDVGYDGKVTHHVFEEHTRR